MSAVRVTFRLDGRLPKLVSKGFCAVTIYVGQQQLRAIPYHASSAGGADATGSARDERMNAFQPVSHLTSASYRRRIRRKGNRNQASMDAELLANVADESNRPHRCATIAVSITLGDELGADHAAGAGLVFDNKILAECKAELLRQRARRYRCRRPRRRAQRNEP